MADALVWVTGASRGIGRALVEAAPERSKVIGVSRGSSPAAHHLCLDLSGRDGWRALKDSFRREVAGFGGSRVVLLQAAGTLDPIGFAGEVDPDAYERNVLVNSAAPQVIGDGFLAAVAGVRARRQLAVIGSGAASSVYPGWSSYGAAKAALDQWVRVVGEEQRLRGGVEVVSIAPGVVDTAMQDLIRATPERHFPRLPRFLELHAGGQLARPADVARRIWAVLDAGLDPGSVLDLRDLPDVGAP